MGDTCAEPQGKFDIVCFGKPKPVSADYSCFKMCQKRYAVKIVPFRY